MWTEEYRPQSLSEVVGNSEQVKELRKWAENWDSSRQAVVLHGPPGVGKTTSAHALANDLGWEVMEMNASDRRTGSIVNRIAGESSKTASLTGARRKLVILDEADNLHGNVDRGGKSAITNLVKESEQPIVLIANDYYELSRTLRRNTEDIEFEYIDENEIARALKRICEDRGIDYEIDALKKIAQDSDGDLRGAINDLRKHAAGVEKLKPSSINTVERDQKEEVFPFLDLLLKEGDTREVRERYEDLDLTPNDLFRWVDENIHREYKDEEEIASGLHSLSRADVWLGKVLESQQYKYWRYASDQLTAGVASARDGKHGGWTRWQPPRYRRRGGVSDELLTKISERAGCSIQTARREVIPQLSAMIPYCKPRELAVDIAAWYDMDEKDLAEITGSGKTTNKVQGIIEDAQQKRSQFEISSNTSNSGTGLESEELEQEKQENDDVNSQDDGLVEELKNIDTIGGKTAQNIAEDYSTKSEIKRATVEELTEVRGISEKRAERVKNTFKNESTDDSNEENERVEETEDESPDFTVEGSEDTEDDDKDQAGLEDFV